MEQYKMTDTEHVYSNGTEYVPIYRMKQWFEHCRNQQFPAADVATVQHGRWGTHSDRPDSLICSICNCGFDMWKHDPHNYCPNCDAKMQE